MRRRTGLVGGSEGQELDEGIGEGFDGERERGALLLPFTRMLHDMTL